MNKKLLVVSILAVFMLLAISFASAVSSNTTTDEKRESPLFRVRTRRAIGDRLQELKENIKAKFIGDRVFFLPFQWLRDLRSGRLGPLGCYSFAKNCLYTGGDDFTCDYTNCISPYKCTIACTS